MKNLLLLAGAVKAQDFGLTYYSDSACATAHSTHSSAESFQVGTCYANKWMSGQTGRMPVAFLTSAGASSGIYFAKYIDHCQNPGDFSGETIAFNTCHPFLDVPGLYVRVQDQSRGRDAASSTGCADNKPCSGLNSLAQNFYSSTDCTGDVSYAVGYPVSSECLRYADGTQQISRLGNQMTMVDHQGSNDCTASAGNQKTYRMPMDNCVAMEGTGSFKIVEPVGSGGGNFGGSSGASAMGYATSVLVGAAAWLLF